MKNLLFAVYDKKAEVYNQIFTQPNRAFAVRGFADACKDQNSPLHNYADDFCLVLVGEMDQKTGKIAQEKNLEILAEAKNFFVEK